MGKIAVIGGGAAGMMADRHGYIIKKRAAKSGFSLNIQPMAAWRFIMKKKYRNLKQKIIFYVMSVSILITILITAIMSNGSAYSTDAILLDNVRLMARVAAQSISSNLHLLTERVANISREAVFLDDTVSISDKQERFHEIEP